MNTMWTCLHQPACLCHGDETDPYSCDCRVLHLVGRVDGLCVDCLQRMALIDADTGEMLPRAAS